ncbi:hypothetical protein GYMLUDRAFT_43253 [Collybiopsis luxurians FD-317 M1]|uniref:Uncharacterized protein n=1 Tax=Collybiopsis luxurians FD-317 M1 TaxID=944289 RepID=A0A0D0BBS4_9AGAR|nr:hypothetical protein GYMLUDRAFT_43253 [Collybiopsis luxurians FD-317 M1]
MLKSEYLSAPTSCRGRFLPLLEDFRIIVVRCEGLHERLNRQNVVLAVARLFYDSKKIQKCWEEVKERGSELRVRISRLKEHWPDHTRPSQSNQSPTLSIAQEHSQSGNTSLNPPHTSIPPSSGTLATVNSLHSVSNATIQNSEFNSAANNVINTTLHYPLAGIVNNSGSVVITINNYGAPDGPSRQQSS